MNANGKQKLEKALSLLGQALDIIKEVRQEEEDAYNVLIDNDADDSREGEQMIDNLTSLDNSTGYIANIAGEINEILDA